MKKTLFQSVICLFVLLLALNVSSQTVRTRDKGDAGFFAPLMYNRTSQNALKKPDPVPVPLSLSGFYTNDFEGTVFPPAGWQSLNVLNPSYAWRFASFPYTGSQCAFIGYDTSPGEDWLILPKFTVTATTDSVSFWLALQYAGYPPDSTFILVSTTDSSMTSFFDVIGTLSEGDNYPTSALAYKYYSFPLDVYNGSDIYIAIVNRNTDGDGVFLDRVSIGTNPAINASVLSFDNPRFIQTGGAVSPTATVLNDGNSSQSFPVTMTITGGYSSTKNVTNLASGSRVQLTFDPWTAQGTAGTQNVSVKAQLSGDAYSNDDSILSSVKVLEPFTNYGWTSRAPLSTPTWGMASAAVNANDTSYLFEMGGNTAGPPYYSKQVDKYAPYSNSWSIENPMPSGAFRAQSAFYNNKIYVMGGNDSIAYQPVNLNRVYDLATKSWSLAAPIPVPVSDDALGIYNDSLFYLIGGIPGTGNPGIVQIYNAASNTWKTATNFPAPLADMSAGIIGNKIIVSGGYNGYMVASTYIGTINVIDPTIITWVSGSDYPAGPCGTLAGGASLDKTSGLVIFTGGATNNDIPFVSSGLTFAYDVNADVWKIGPPKPTPANNLIDFTPVIDNDSLYMVAVGGYGATVGLNVNEWLNLGPYKILSAIQENHLLNLSLKSYPNPFVNFTNITFSLTRASIVKAVIVDLTGKEVEVLCNKNLQTGPQQLTWNASGYSQGVYFCKLFIDGIPITQILLKY